MEVTFTADTTYVPASGGTVTFDLTVTNNGTEPCFTDCVVLVKKNRNNVAFADTLESGTILPGGVVTGSYSLTFPPTAPNGEYRVAFYAGLLSTGEFYDRQNVRITKGGPPPRLAGLSQAPWGDAAAFGAAVVAEPGWEGVFSGASSAAVTTTASASAVRTAPNPFSGATRIAFETSASSEVRLAVYDVLGREVAVLVEEALAAGAHAAVFDAAGLASGTYVYQLVVGSTVQTGRMTLTR